MENFAIYDPFDFAQDMFIIYYYLFLCGLCASVAIFIDYTRLRGHKLSID